MLRWLKYKFFAILMFMFAFVSLIDISWFTLVLIVIGLGFWKYGDVVRGYAATERGIRKSARIQSLYDSIFFNEYDKYR